MTRQEEPGHETPETAMREVAARNKAAGRTRNEVDTTLGALVAPRHEHLIPQILDEIFGHDEHILVVNFRVTGGSRETATSALQNALQVRFRGGMPLRDSVTFEDFKIYPDQR